jgi:hypothetical protein
MKRYLGILTLFVSCAIYAGESTTNLLAIHLVDIPLHGLWSLDGSRQADSLSLVSPPVLSDSDFVAFDVTNHTFVIKPAAAKRLSQSIWDLGKRDAPGWRNRSGPTVHPNGNYELIPCPAPFVLKASGKPIYVGAFWTLASSRGITGPVAIPKSPFIKTNQTNNVHFSIEFWDDALQPQPNHRSDPRIVAAVRKLLAHEKR